MRLLQSLTQSLNVSRVQELIKVYHCDIFGISKVKRCLSDILTPQKVKRYYQF